MTRRTNIYKFVSVKLMYIAILCRKVVNLHFFFNLCLDFGMICSSLTNERKRFHTTLFDEGESGSSQILSSVWVTWFAPYPRVVWVCTTL